MFPFVQKEKVLCFHGPQLYEANILDTSKRDATEDEEGGNWYKVHYKGWKVTWDEWVPESRVLKHNPANLKQQQELAKAPANIAATTQKKESKASRGDARSKKQMQSQDDYLNTPAIKIGLNDTLSKQLVDDWEHITKSQKLVSLPREITVRKVLQDFLNSKKLDDITNETVAGLILYFNTALGNRLLYRQERQQYSDIRNTHGDKQLVDVYGPEHLLRLFVQLPSLLAYTTMDQEAIATLRESLNEITRFITGKMKEYFPTDVYEASSPEYQSLETTV